MENEFMRKTYSDAVIWYLKYNLHFKISNEEN